MSRLYNFSYQTASFRGAQFAVFDAEVLFGRRNVLHEYPLRDEPYGEDLGKKAREYTINAFVIGNNLRGARDALIAAIEGDDSPGTLVHPTLGSLLVIPKDCRIKFDNREGGIEYFTLTFVEAGSNATPSLGGNTSFLSKSIGLSSISTFANFFKGIFNITGLPDFLHTNALHNLIGTDASTASGGGTDFVSTIQNLFQTGSFGSDNTDYTQLTNTLSKFQSSAATDLADPETLASKISGIITQSSDVYLNQDTSNNFIETVRPNNAATMALEAQKRLQNYGDDFIVPPLTTPERVQEYENQIQLVNLIINISLAQMVIITSDMDFPSRQDALLVRDSVDDYMQAQILSLADRGEDEPYLALVKIRTAMVKDINTRAATLKNKKYIQIRDAMPAIAFAYDQYEDATRDEEIVQRNRVRNPVFIPPNSSVEILV